jgi:hypothetical protein
MHTSRMQTDLTRIRSAAQRRADLFLVIVVAGALTLAIGSVVEDPGALPADAFASVNGEALPGSQLEDVLLQLGEQLGRPPGPAERAEVVARLVDEELLLQQGLALGLARAETRLRSQLVQEVIRHAVAESAAAPVEDAELADFFERHAAYFRRPDSFRIERFTFADLADARRAASGHTLALEQGQRDSSLPATALTEARWRDYLGSSLSARVAALPDGGVLLEQREGSAPAVLRLGARVSGTLPGMADIRPQVEAEFRRRRDEKALESYVTRLRRDARIITEGGDDSP